jgi:UDP-N-acetylglucosamine acyltransferase
MAEVKIHPSAIIEPGAELDAGVVLGPFCLVGANVKIGKGTRLISHAVVAGRTTLGEENEVYPFASIGHAPQDLKYKGEPTTLQIGNKNRIREYATLQPGTVQGGGKTVVGNGNLFMAYTHVAHDCIVGNENVFANAAQLAGHVVIENQAVLGSMSALHQFCRMGSLAMTGAGSMVAQDIPPFCMVHGDHAVLRGLNLVALRRRGLSNEAIAAVKTATKIIFWGKFPTVDAALAKCVEEGLLNHPPVVQLIDFVKSSRRGVCRPDMSSAGSSPD